MKKTLITLGALATIANASSFTQTAFNPDISLIIDASYVDRNIDDSEISHYEIPGVVHGLIGGHSHGDESHATYNAANGFNLNYGELGLRSSVDPYFTMDAIFHFSEDSVEIEEAYVTTTTLPYGLRAKGGKFYSDFGRHNNSHHHAWNFADAPLVNQSFLGLHGLLEKGVQLQWLAPLPHYMMVGAELLQGENEQMFGNGAIVSYHEEEHHEEGAEEEHGHGEVIAEAEDKPSLVVAYLKASADIDQTTLLAGLSYASGKSRLNHLDDEEGAHAFYGESELYGFDLTLKHYFDSYRYLMWENEWIKREMDGTYYNAEGEAHIPMLKEQSGYYTQLIYAHNKNWRAGVRYDNIYQNDVIANGVNKNLDDGLDRVSIMAEYNPSEFSRIRLQYNVNSALYNEEGEQEDVKTIIVQFNYAIGAHGAHAF